MIRIKYIKKKKKMPDVHYYQRLNPTLNRTRSITVLMQGGPIKLYDNLTFANPDIRKNNNKRSLFIVYVPVVEQLVLDVL